MKREIKVKKKVKKREKKRWKSVFTVELEKHLLRGTSVKGDRTKLGQRLKDILKIIEKNWEKLRNICKKFEEKIKEKYIYL